MKYEKFEYLYPPRPESAIPFDMMGWYERKKWVAQYKKNGTCSIIAISPEKEYTAMNRHAEAHKQWQLTEYIKKELTRIFPEKCWIVLVVEILHAKTKSIKDTIYIHDIIVYNNKFLFDTTFMDRQKLLERLKTDVVTETHYVCDAQNKIWFAKLFEKDFEKLFKSIKDITVDEGLVLKDPTGKLKYCDTPKANEYWQVKVRHSSKKYLF